MNTLRYLRRIGLNSLRPPSPEALAELQQQHLLTIPFENLDILRNIPITLDTAKLYDKIVGDRRGGFCYELNGLFAALLSELGYPVDMVSARVFNDKGDAGPEFDHMALLVTLESERYLVDVGFGDSARGPIRMPAGEAEDISGRYRVRPLKDVPDGFALERADGNDWAPRYQFTDLARELDEFSEMCEYHQSSPDSHFTQRNLITIATSSGRITLTDKKLTETEAGLKMERPVASVDEFTQLLAERFGIKLA
ncbi:acetyltransferase [candidate division GN15 bacterium]|nr:acetyltransferase [candidate division GN15 bacterium]